MKILFGGDVSFGMYNYPGDEKIADILKEVKPLFDSADFKMLNLENIFGDKAYTPILKSGPNLISTGKFISFFQELKVQVVGMANNHTGDYGEEPILNTFDILDHAGIAYVGAGKTIAEAYAPYVFEKDGIRVSVIAVCENEFGTAKKDKAGSAGYHLGKLTEGILAEKKKGNRVVIYFHGGNERNPYPSPDKVCLYRHFVDLGADAVVAMHTHCPQGYETYQGCPIIYSMGNFFFPWGEDEEIEKLSGNWYFGYLTALDFSENGVSVNLHPYKFSANEIVLLKGEQLEKFRTYLAQITAPIHDEDALSKLFDGWCILDGVQYAERLVFSKEMLHNGAEKVCGTRNLFTCEAHNELMRSVMLLCFEGDVEAATQTAKKIEKMQVIDI